MHVYHRFLGKSLAVSYGCIMISSLGVKLSMRHFENTVFKMGCSVALPSACKIFGACTALQIIWLTVQFDHW